MANLSKAFYRWKEVFVIIIIVRFLLIVFSILTVKDQQTNFLYNWVRWDGPHYIEIAKNWYQRSEESSLFIVFYPLYPILIKVFAFFLKDFLISSITVSFVFAVICSIALFELARLDFNKATAIKSVLFLNIFPTAYFLQASYTESLFLTLTLLTFYFYRKKLNFASGIMGALSSFTRANGILLLPALLIETKLSIKKLIALLLMPLGFGSYLLINYLTFGNVFYFTEPLAENWFKKYDWPWTGTKNLIDSIPNFTHPNFYIYFAEFVAIIFIFLMIIIVYLKVRKSYALYMCLNCLLFISTSYILSTPRYTLSLFPIFIALGTINNRKVLIVTSIFFILSLFYFTYLYTQGRWAF